MLGEQGLLSDELVTAPCDALVIPMTEDLGFAISAATVLRQAGVRTQLCLLYTSPPQRRMGPMPQRPKSKSVVTDPVMIFQVLTEEQLSPELAAMRPKYIYVPLMLMADHFDKVSLFTENGAVPVAVLPRVITDNELKGVYSALTKVFDLGVNEALVGNLGHAMLARQAGDVYKRQIMPRGRFFPSMKTCVWGTPFSASATTLTCTHDTQKQQEPLFPGGSCCFCFYHLINFCSCLEQS